MPDRDQPDRELIWFARQMVVPGALLLLIGSLWAVASPLGGGPDEKDHVIRAYTAIRGDLVGDETELGGGSAGYTVPAWLLNLEAACFARLPAQPASCAIPLGSDSTETETLSRAGLSPPLYHLLTGVPLAVAEGRAGVYGARFISAAAVAAMIGAAIVVASRHRARALLVPALVVSWTPTAQFLTGVVNPSSLEIAAAVLIWVSGLALLDDGCDLSRGLRIGLFTIASAVFVLDRQLSPVLYAIIAIALLALATRARIRELARARSAHLGIALIAIAGVAAVLWLLVYRPLDAANDNPPNVDDSNTELTAFAFGRQTVVLLQMIGWFGWVDLREPRVAAYLWIAAAVIVAVLALSQSSRRTKVVVAAMVLVSVALPVAIEVSSVRTYGVTWQGRYTLPLAMGPLLIAAARSSFTGTAADLVAGVGRTVCTVAPFLAWIGFGAALRRNSVGTDAPFWEVVTDPVWDPPTTTWFLLALSFVASVALAVYLRSVASTGSDRLELAAS